MSMKIRTYSELIQLPTFIARYRYLRLGSKIGEITFGWERYLNQEFYKYDEDWKAARRAVIIRDNGCDLGIDGRDIIDAPVIVHHMNPLTEYDIINRTKYLLDPEYLISTIDNTHKAIHYGDESLLITEPIVRRKNDTCPWR